MDVVDRFLCDGMLGSVARWLRLLGFDAAYAGGKLSDDEVLAWAEREQRFLATRDLNLTQRALKQGLGVLLLKEGPKEEQMLLLIIHTGAEVDPAKFFTRCTDCGALLAPASLEDVRADVPAGVAATQDKFWRCPACRHVYWKGSHVTDIEAHIIELAKKIAAQ